MRAPEQMPSFRIVYCIIANGSSFKQTGNGREASPSGRSHGRSYYDTESETNPAWPGRSGSPDFDAISLAQSATEISFGGRLVGYRRALNVVSFTWFSTSNLHVWFRFDSR